MIPTIGREQIWNEFIIILKPVRMVAVLPITAIGSGVFVWHSEIGSQLAFLRLLRHNGTMS